MLYRLACAETGVGAGRCGIGGLSSLDALVLDLLRLERERCRDGFDFASEESTVVEEDCIVGTVLLFDFVDSSEAVS